MSDVSSSSSSMMPTTTTTTTSTTLATDKYDDNSTNHVPDNYMQDNNIPFWQKCLRELPKDMCLVSIIDHAKISVSGYVLKAHFPEFMERLTSQSFAKDTDILLDCSETSLQILYEYLYTETCIREQIKSNHPSIGIELFKVTDFLSHSFLHYEIGKCMLSLEMMPYHDQILWLSNICQDSWCLELLSKIPFPLPYNNSTLTYSNYLYVLGCNLCEPLIAKHSKTSRSLTAEYCRFLTLSQLVGYVDNVEILVDIAKEKQGTEQQQQRFIIPDDLSLSQSLHIWRCEWIRKADLILPCFAISEYHSRALARPLKIILLEKCCRFGFVELWMWDILDTKEMVEYIESKTDCDDYYLAMHGQLRDSSSFFKNKKSSIRQMYSMLILIAKYAKFDEMDTWAWKSLLAKTTAYDIYSCLVIETYYSKPLGFTLSEFLVFLKEWIRVETRTGDDLAVLAFHLAYSTNFQTNNEREEWEEEEEEEEEQKQKSCLWHALVKHDVFFDQTDFMKTRLLHERKTQKYKKPFSSSSSSIQTAIDDILAVFMSAAVASKPVVLCNNPSSSITHPISNQMPSSRTSNKNGSCSSSSSSSSSTCTNDRNKRNAKKNVSSEYSKAMSKLVRHNHAFLMCITREFQTMYLPCLMFPHNVLTTSVFSEDTYVNLQQYYSKHEKLGVVWVYRVHDKDYVDPPNDSLVYKENAERICKNRQCVFAVNHILYQRFYRTSSSTTTTTRDDDDNKTLAISLSIPQQIVSLFVTSFVKKH